MRSALASFQILILTAMLADTAMACSCPRNPTAESILNGAAAVFRGVARESALVAPGRSITTFTVVEMFKGPTAGVTLRVLHRSGSSASCGVKFAPGQTYTLAAHRAGSEPGLTTSLCSTWMFAPQVGLSADLIRGLREIQTRE